MRRRLPLITFLLAAMAIFAVATASATVGPISFSGSDPIDFGNQAVGTVSNAITVTITNTGDQDMVIDNNGVSVSGANQGSFLTSNDSCSGATVAAGASCTVDVTFSPTNGTGGYSASLDVVDTADSVSGSTGLIGNGTGAPTADPSPGNLSFGSQSVNTTSSAQTVTLTNNGNIALHVASVSKGGSDPASFPLSNNSCDGATVAAGDHCTVDVSFNPTATGGASASLIFTDDAGDSPQNVSLSGSGTAASVSVSPNPFDFGDRKVGTSDSQVFTVTNNGGAPLNIPAAGVSVTGAAFSKSGDGCSGTSVAIGNSCTFTVQFQPGSAGAQSGLASITSNDPASPFGVSLSGNGTVPHASPSSTVSFATAINTSDTQTVTLTNDGNAALVVQTAVLTGSLSFTKIITATPCGGATLQPGEHCTVQIQFSPTSTAAQNGALTFTDDSGAVAGSTQGVAITGTVLIPGIGATPATGLGFEQLPVGRLSNASTVTVKNTGHANLHISSIVIGGLNYKSFRLGLQSCTQAAIVPGDTCTVNVRFAPTKLGSRVASLLVRNDANGSASTLNLALTGVGIRPPGVLSLHGSAGCTDTRLTWTAPDAAGLLRVQVVRNVAHDPRGPFDGVVLSHTAGALTNTGLAQFHTYHYAVYAVYTAFDGSRLVYSAGAFSTLHTGRVCTPRNGALISDLSPAVDWTAYAGARSYAYILQRSGHTILVRYPKLSQVTLPSSWTFNGQAKSIQRGGVYSFYVYAYTAGRPRGFLIGQTVFTER